MAESAAVPVMRQAMCMGQYSESSTAVMINCVHTQNAPVFRLAAADWGKVAEGKG